MTTRRTTGNRRTVVCVGDGRVAGAYEETREGPSIAGVLRFFAPAARSSVGITCSGRVLRPGRVELVGLACPGPHGSFGVDLVELLAAVGLEHDAEVIVFTNGIGDQLAIPARNLMTSGRLVLEPTCERPSHKIPVSVRLDLAGWTDAALPFSPASMSAVSFREFVRCQ